MDHQPIEERRNKHYNDSMVKKLQEGIDNQEFILYYQPQLHLSTGKVVGMEALIRWMHPQEGMIPPVEFIPLAEKTGQIYAIENWVVRTALEQKKKWELQGFQEIELSINLSGKTIEKEEEFDKIEELFDHYEIDYSKIVIEITETVLIRNLDLVVDRLLRLKNRGIRIALDDFGTGYSSLTYLTRLPVDVIKLDRSYVQSIPENFIDTTVIRNLLTMACDLSFKVIAEGIETIEQLEFLKNHCCYGGQGFYFSKPVPTEQISEMMMQ
jgi:FOG: EAL domain